MQETRTGMGTVLKATLTKLQHLATGVVPESCRLHRDFAFMFNGWHLNAHAKREGLVPDREAEKVRILFDHADMTRLDGCPYMARLGPSADLTRSHRFCTFLYPRPSETAEDIRIWAADRGFAHVSVLNRAVVPPAAPQTGRLEAMG